MKIDSKKNKRALAARALGADQPSVFEMVDRANYTSDEEYLDAVTKMELERKSPEYQEVYRRLAREYRAQQEETERKEQEAAYQEIRAQVQLNSMDKKEIDREATAMARRDLAAGKISASDLGKAIEGHAKQLSEKRKEEKAGNQLFNSVIRGLVANRTFSTEPAQKEEPPKVPSTAYMSKKEEI